MADDLENMSFEQFLGNKLRERGLNLKRLSELSGISLKHLQGLGSGNFSNLPSAPYLRGYFMKLGQILDFDYEFWWKKTKEERLIKDSGAEDILPKNRFAKKSLPKFLWLALIILILAVYFITQSSKIFGKPTIIVTYPDQNPISVASSEIVIKGALKNSSELSINGETVVVSADGQWEKTILLQSGLNTLELKAKKFLGGETKFVQQILYQPPFTNAEENLKTP